MKVLMKVGDRVNILKLCPELPGKTPSKQG